MFSIAGVGTLNIAPTSFRQEPTSSPICVKCFEVTSSFLALSEEKVIK